MQKHSPPQLQDVTELLRGIDLNLGHTPSSTLPGQEHPTRQRRVAATAIPLYAQLELFPKHPHAMGDKA